MKRVLTALLLIPLIAGIIFYAPAPLVAVTLAAAALLCLRELFDLADRLGPHPFRIFGYGAGAVLIVAPELPQPAFFVALCLTLLILALQPSRPLQDSFGAVASTLFGLVYVCGPFALAREIHRLDPHWLFFVLLLNWTGDSAAFYFGRALGRHRLLPRVSPNKTWEGTLASLLLAATVGVGYLLYFQPGAVGGGAALLISVAVNVSGQLGDLAESALKRAAQVKDSGGLLPGHGGMLDRLDGVLFSVPVAYFCLAWWV